MKKKSSILFLLLGVVSATGMQNPKLPDAKITLRVSDINGKAISNAEVSIGFNQGGNAWVGEHKSKTFTGMTNSNGCFSSQANCLGEIGGSVNKKGHYQSVFSYDYKGTYQNKKHWDPWNPIVNVSLKRIRNPIPMYAKRVDTILPKANQEIGYDLKVGDFIAPYGTGIRSDLIFNLTGYYRGKHDYDGSLKLTFQSENDGIILFKEENEYSSQLLSNHEAPNLGYQHEWSWRKTRTPPTGNRTSTLSENHNYYFRIRTVLDESGDIISAYYGKIYGEIRFGGVSQNGSFLQIPAYYLNPTANDRNIEFDPEQNLFRNLRPSEQVRAP